MILRPLALILICLSFFFATAKWIRESAPLPNGYPHYAEFIETIDEYEVIYLGSSFVRRGIIPTTVEQFTGLSSYNLGVNGARGHQIKHTLEWVLDRNPEKLKWVVIQMPHWFKHPIRNTTSYQSIYWHTPRVTRDYIHSIGLAEIDSEEKKKFINEQVIAGAKRLTNLGLGHQFGRKGATRPHYKGFDPAYQMRADGSMAGGHAEFLAESAKYETWVEMLDKRNGRPWLGSYDYDALESLKSSAVKANVKLIFLIPPSAGVTANERWLGQNGYATPLLDYNSPTAYPELFATEVRYNKGHLSTHGAEIFSEKLGKDLAILFNSQPE